MHQGTSQEEHSEEDPDNAVVVSLALTRVALARLVVAHAVRVLALPLLPQRQRFGWTPTRSASRSLTQEFITMDLNNFSASASGLLVPGQATPAPRGLILAPSTGLITDLSGVDLNALGLKF